MVGENLSSKGEESEQYNSSGIEDLANMPDFAEHMAERMKESAVEKLGDGMTTTVSVYIEGGSTMTPQELKKRKGEAEAYTAERQAWHEEVLNQAAVDARELSKKLGPPPRIIAMRGGCGAGKTTAVREKYGDKGIIVNGDVPGAVKPDYFKDVIKGEARDSLGIEVTSSQAHMESTGICRMHTERLVGDPEVSLLIDKQLESAGDIPEIIEWGKESGKSVELLDNDVPIELSAFRVLKRPIGGADPNIEFSGVARGFIGIRANRGQVLEDVKDEIVSSYSLRAFDPVSKRQLEVAKKVDGKIVYEPGYEELGKAVGKQDEVGAKAEATIAEGQVITPAYIEEFVSKYFDESENAPEWSKKGAKEAREILGSYVRLGGITLGEALDSKAAGLDPTKTDQAEIVKWVLQQRAARAKTSAA